MSTASCTVGSSIISAAEMSAINPMICEDGDSYRVSSALTAVSCLFEKFDNGVTLDGAQTFGISMILETCAAALRRLEDLKP